MRSEMSILCERKFVLTAFLKLFKSSFNMAGDGVGVWAKNLRHHLCMAPNKKIFIFATYSKESRKEIVSIKT